MSILWASREELEDPRSPFADDAIASASYILWALSGRKYNFPRSVIEKYQCPIYRDSYYGRPTPDLRNGSVYNVCMSCGTPSAIRLRNTPALKIEYVSYRDEILDPSTYSLVNRAILSPADYHHWDLCQGVKVRYRFGQPPPVSGRRAAKYLADQFVKSWSGSACKLPQRMTSITREGVSMTVLDTQDFLDQGKTGVYEIDLFLRAANPTKALNRARVFSPDKPRAARLMDYEMLPEDTDIRIIPGEVYEKDFIDVPGPSLDGITWKPRGQIDLEFGGTAIVLGDDYWTVIPDGVHLEIPPADSMYDSVTNGTFNLYAVRIDDENVTSLIYTSRVFVTAHEV